MSLNTSSRTAILYQIPAWQSISVKLREMYPLADNRTAWMPSRPTNQPEIRSIRDPLCPNQHVRRFSYAQAGFWGKILRQGIFRFAPTAWGLTPPMTTRHPTENSGQCWRLAAAIGKTVLTIPKKTGGEDGSPPARIGPASVMRLFAVFSEGTGFPLLTY
jgi:hypothetical protein